MAATPPACPLHPTAARDLHDLGEGVRRAVGPRRHRALLREPQLGRRVPEVRFVLGVDQIIQRRHRRLALEPARAVVGARIRAVVGLPGHVQPELLEHLAVPFGLRPQRGQEVPHHHAVQPRLDRELLELAVSEVLVAPAAEPEERAGDDQPEDRDPLDDLPRVHQLAAPELGARARVQQVDRHRGGLEGGELERHLHALLGRLAEIEDASHARFEARLANRLDRAHAALVADRRGDLRVVALRSLDVVVHTLHAGVLERLRARHRHVPDRHAALEVRVLGHEPGAVDDVLEVALREPLPLGDHAEAVRSRGLGRSRVLEDLVRGHHRVHRRVRLREA